MQVIAGRFKGTSLQAPKVSTTHPMGSREKLALFNRIAFLLPGATVLDAFAGSGALGIEALSRGAKTVVFIEKSAAALAVIRQNLARLPLPPDQSYQLLHLDVVDFATKIRFDLILADPPYQNYDPTPIAKLGQFLRSQGQLILSHPRSTAAQVSGLQLQDSRHYAAAQISTFTKA